MCCSHKLTLLRRTKVKLAIHHTVCCIALIDNDMKLHWMNKKLFITTSKTIKENDMYLDTLVHPKMIQYPLVMWGFCDGSIISKKTIQSHSGTTSPVSTSRKIVLVIG